MEDGNSMPLKIEQVFSRIAQHNVSFEQPFDFKTFWTLTGQPKENYQTDEARRAKQIFQKHPLDCPKANLCPISNPRLASTKRLANSH